MAQHDYVIANDTAANVRSDLNDALSAIVSQNSGASAPSTTYANMIWYDSGNNILKIRSEADDAWIDMGEVDQADSKFLPANTVPAGTVISFAASSEPNGWLECDGSAISRTTYSNLFSTIGTAFGSGDGSTTFNLPDLRGEFIRGWDNTRGVDSGRSFATSQTDAFQGHRHELTDNAGTAINSSNFVGDGGTALPGYRGTASNDNARTIKADGVNGTPRTASETRPRNIALLYCIKY